MKLNLFEMGETSEKVSFTCPGCGRDTTIHAGTRTDLLEKRCLQCRGSLRSGRGRAAKVKGRTIGTHEGRRTGDKANERRETKRLASLRNRMRRSGVSAKNGTTHRMPCASYDECNHKKHTLRTARR